MRGAAGRGLGRWFLQWNEKFEKNWEGYTNCHIANTWTGTPVGHTLDGTQCLARINFFTGLFLLFS